jgi:hypothetical protein
MATIMDDKTSPVAKYLKLQTQKLKAALNAARLFEGTNDTGHVAENAVREFLETVLPNKYSIGVGEAIAPRMPEHITQTQQKRKRKPQTQQKDVLIYDAHGAAIFGWGGVSLFPIESVYGVIEVKTSIKNVKGLLQAVKQALEVNRLCTPKQGPKPFTAVFAFEATIKSETIFNTLLRLEPQDRVDFILILKPKEPRRPKEPKKTEKLKESGEPKEYNGTSIYITHWHYHSQGSGLIDFVSAQDVAQERSDVVQRKPKAEIRKYLTIANTDDALLFFYLFLLDHLSNMTLSKPNLLEYVRASEIRTGYLHDESGKSWNPKPKPQSQK